MATLGELVIELGIVGDTKKLEVLNAKVKEAGKKAQETAEKFKKTDNGVKSFIKSVGAIAGAVSAAAIAINKLTNDLVRSNQAMLDLTRTTDIAQGTFQKWGGIGKMLGVENADQQLASLNERLFELRLTGEGARGFQLAGINPMGQDANGVLEQLRSRVAGMSDTTATYLLKQMGLDPRMLHLLRMSRGEFDALGQTIKKYQLTPEQTKQIQTMNIQLQIAGTKLKYLKDRALLALMPYWLKFMQSATRVAEMLAKVGKEVGKFVVKWRGLVGIFALGLSKIKAVQSFFLSINSSVKSLLTKIPVLGRAFAALGGIFAKALLPLTALYLLLDDIAGYMTGADSLIGRVIEWAKGSGGEIGDAFKKMFGGDFLGGGSDLVEAISKQLDSLISVLARLVDIFTGFTHFADNPQAYKNALLLTNPLTSPFVLGGKAVDFGKDLNNNFLKPQLQNLINNSSTTNNNKLSMTNHFYGVQQPIDELANQMNRAQFSQSVAFV